MRKIFSILIILTAIFYFDMKGYAGDILFRLTHEDQDALVVGKITDYDESKYTVEVIRVISGKLSKKTVEINSDFKYSFLNTEPSLEDYCVLSLDKVILGYEIKWGAYKVNSGDYNNLKFVKTDLSDGMKVDLTAFEYYINSNGEYNDFYFEGTTAYFRDKNGKSTVIYPVEDDKDIDKLKGEKGNIVNSNETLSLLSKAKQNISYIYFLTALLIIVGIIFFMFKIKRIIRK